MSSISKIKDMIANVKAARHKAQQQGNRKMINDTLAREARLEKELVKAQWKERQIKAMEAQQELKTHQKSLKKKEHDLRWGPTVRAIQGVGQSLGSGIKKAVKVAGKAGRSARAQIHRGRARIESYDSESAARRSGSTRIHSLDASLDSAGAGIRSMERHDAAAARAAARKRPPDPYHRTGAVHAGHFEISGMDQNLVNKVRRTRGE
jgi:hypothetical protein